MKVLLLALVIIATVFGNKKCLDNIRRNCEVDGLCNDGPCGIGGGCKVMAKIHPTCWPLFTDLSPVYNNYYYQDVNKVMYIISQNYNLPRIDLIKFVEQQHSHNEVQILKEVLEFL